MTNNGTPGVTEEKRASDKMLKQLQDLCTHLNSLLPVMEKWSTRDDEFEAIKKTVTENTVLLRGVGEDKGLVGENENTRKKLYGNGTGGKKERGLIARQDMTDTILAIQSATLVILTLAHWDELKAWILSWLHLKP